VARVTQRVDPERLGDLLERPLRAAIATARGAEVDPVAVAYRRREGRTFVGVPRALSPAAASEPVVLLLDDGRYWYELRAVTIRGRLAAATPPPGGDPQLVWLEVVPERAVAWDYGSLREEADA
jgi:hypothetical protein